jgi:hypothetical protein
VRYLSLAQHTKQPAPYVRIRLLRVQRHRPKLPSARKGALAGQTSSGITATYANPYANPVGSALHTDQNTLAAPTRTRLCGPPSTGQTYNETEWQRIMLRTLKPVGPLHPFQTNNATPCQWQSTSSDRCHRTRVSTAMLPSPTLPAQTFVSSPRRPTSRQSD